MVALKFWHVLGIMLWSVGLVDVCWSQAEDEEFRPGLIAEYRTGDRRVERVDADITFVWDDATPDARLPGGTFEAAWRGLVLIRLEAKHRLHAFVQGDVTVEIDGQRVLHGSAKQPQWISGDEFVPGFGERPLVVTFRKTESAAQLKLFWSSDSFGLEPLPPELLFHDDTSFNPNANGVGANGKNATDKPTRAHADGVAVKHLADDLALIELGRKQFEGFRCGRCHQRGGEEQPPPGSSLKHFAASGFFNDQVSEHFGFGTQEPDQIYPRFYLHDPSRDAVEAFLFDQSQPVELEKPKLVKEADLETERRKGEVLLRSTGCLACHRVGELGGTSPSPFAGPDLGNVGERRTLPWLVTWLAKPERLNADHRMPVFNLTDAERNQLALALWRLTESDAKEPPPGLTEVELTALWKNWRSFKSKKEEPQQAHYKAIVERGRKVVVERRCAACHRFSDDNAVRFEKPASDLSQPVTDWSKSCLAANSDYSQNIRPVFGEKLNRDAIKAYLASRREMKLSPLSTFARGQKLLEQKGCLACHSRHGVGGIGKMAAQIAKFDKDFAGQAPSLVPPSLNAVGDKLLDEALSIAVRGERQPIRMPWLKVRMPKFSHSPDELASLTRYLVEHDRIPLREERRGAEVRSGGGEEVRSKTEDTRPTSSTPPLLSSSPPLLHPSSPQTHLAGQALTGVRGWSCIACHKIGDYEPKQVALGARGSDLKMLGKHIRPEFFFRWIASPLRVIPGVEMPQYNRPVAGVLDGDLAKQHAALWQALNDPNFQPPTNPANVEQLFVVNTGDRPRIVRDVFQLPKELGGGNVPRSFAVGFDNGHSLLFDAETASVRQWTFGDFARQQVVGKRWFWQMAGVDVLRSLPSPQFALRRKSDPKAHVLMASTRTFEPMGNCRVDPLDVHLSYFLYFIVDEQPDDLAHEYAAIRVDESLTPITNDPTRSGVQRRLNLTWTNAENTADFELWFARPSNMAGVGEPRIELVGRSAFGRLPVTTGQQESKDKTETSNLPKADRPTWQRLSIRDRMDEAWEWTELPMRHSPAEPLPTTQVTLTYTAELQRQPLAIPTRPIVSASRLAVSSVPGFEGTQLPLDASIMPTGFAWRPSGSLVMSSLKGHVFAASDSNGDGLEDQLQLLHEGLSAPYGVHVLNEVLIRARLGNEAAKLPDPFTVPMTERSVLVASRQDLALLVDLDGDGYCERQIPIAHDWGLTDDYHEWTTGPVRDSQHRLIWGLSSDYTDKNRPKDRSRWRGKVLRQILDPRTVREEGPFSLGPTPVGHSFRYPTGIAINERDEVFVSDQQGVQNCFNEINYLVEGAHYGVPSTHEEDKDAPETKAAIQIPHPWTRSVNGLVFLTGKEGYPDLKGHGIGCEVNGRFLIRFTTQRVGDVMQGAVYPFSMTDDEVRSSALRRSDEGKNREQPPQGGTTSGTNFEGPLCCGVSPKGEIYIGSIADSGWAGGQNTGSIVKLKGNGQRPNGIQEIRATRDGFEIEFFAPVDRERATNGENYSISGYTRVWGGAYATPDSDRHRCKVLAIELSDDCKTAKLKVDSRKTPNYVYDISCRDVAPPDKAFFPSYGFFTLHRIPSE
ncbi:MAG: c-type cytochrome [Planctomycetia bacterium]|nr:c-type cytochrome [Planctomycetia bacterium]